MFNLALITRVDWSQQGLSLWGSRGLSLISPWLLIIGTSPGLKETSVHFPILCQYRSNIFRPFFLSLDHSYRLTSHLKNFLKRFPGGVCKLRVSNSHISSNSLYQISVLLLLLLSRFSRVWLCATRQTAAYQALLSLGFSRQERWSGLPFPSSMHENEKRKWSRSVVSDS